MVKMLVVADDDDGHDGGKINCDNVSNCDDTFNGGEIDIVIGIYEKSNDNKVGTVIVDDGIDASNESHYDKDINKCDAGDYSGGEEMDDDNVASNDTDDKNDERVKGDGENNVSGTDGIVEKGDDINIGEDDGDAEGDDREMQEW